MFRVRILLVRLFHAHGLAFGDPENFFQFKVMHGDGLLFLIRQVTRHFRYHFIYPSCQGVHRFPRSRMGLGHIRVFVREQSGILTRIVLQPVLRLVGGIEVG